MPDQPSPRRRFQFSLRDLLVVTALVAVIAATVPLLTTPPAVAMGPNIQRPDEEGRMQNVPSAIDPEAKWRVVAVLLDFSILVGFCLYCG